MGGYFSSFPIEESFMARGLIYGCFARLEEKINFSTGASFKQNLGV